MCFSTETTSVVGCVFVGQTSELITAGLRHHRRLIFKSTLAWRTLAISIGNICYEGFDLDKAILCLGRIDCVPFFFTLKKKLKIMKKAPDISYQCIFDEKKGLWKVRMEWSLRLDFVIEDFSKYYFFKKNILHKVYKCHRSNIYMKKFKLSTEDSLTYYLKIL